MLEPKGRWIRFFSRQTATPGTGPRAKVVISAGTSVRESTKLIEAAGATPSAVLIALDRQEKGGNATEMTETSAVQDVEKTLGIPVVSIASLENLLAFMDGDSPAAREAAKFRDAVAAYRARYGA